MKERIMYCKSDKDKRKEKVDRSLKRANQKGISNFLNMEQHLTKSDYFDKQREEINKIKRKDIGINNTRDKERKMKKKELSMFGLE